MHPRARDQLGDFKDLGANFGCNRYSHNLVQCARRALKGNPDSTFDLGYIDLEQKTCNPWTTRSARGCDLCLRYGPFHWRRGSESNRRTRICSPLHGHSATPPRRDQLGRPITLAGSRVDAPKENGEAILGFPACTLERETSLELATSTLARLRSTN